MNTMSYLEDEISDTFQGPQNESHDVSHANLLNNRGRRDYVG